MAKYRYIYVGADKDYWDAKGKTVISITSSQKDLEHLFNANIEGVVRVEQLEPNGK